MMIEWKVRYKTLAQASVFSIAQKEVNMPFMMYGDWYLPNCPIRFPTESEALEYMSNREEYSGGDRMSGKSNFNSYEKDARNYTNEVKQRVWKRSYSTHDFYTAALSGNVLADIGKNGTICGIRL